ncbi:MAG: hypothetical protein ACYDHM_00700 [Acidiferrobacterales bacterium]
MPINRSGKVIGTRERLSGISQYFLSEPDAGATGQRASPCEPRLLPVLVDSELTQGFVYALARALHTRGLTAIVLHVESSLRSADPRSSSLRSRLDLPANLRRHLREELGESKQPPRVCLIPVTDPGDPHLREYERTLIAVGASLPALKRSYLHIKRLAVDGVPAGIGVIVVGAASDEDVRRYSGRLAAAAMRFLGRTLVPVGGVVTPDAATNPADNTGEVLGKSLRSIVDALVREGFLGDVEDSGATQADVPLPQKNLPGQTR